MQIKATMKCYFTFIKDGYYLKKKKENSVDKDIGTRTFVYCWWKHKMM